MNSAHRLGSSDSPSGSNLYAMRRAPPEFFSRLAREYGDVVRFRWSDHPNHPDYMREVLVTQDRGSIR